MKFTETPLKGAYVIELEKREDERGFFARFFCAKEFEQYALKPNFVQVNNSFSVNKGTLRGMHYQLAPKQETKLLRCIQGSLYDVILDLRAESPTFGQSYGVELSAENRRMIYVPQGFAHGFYSLKDNTEALYLVSEYYDQALERGICWNDPAFKIKWPGEPAVVSQKDSQHPAFDPVYHLGVK